MRGRAHSDLRMRFVHGCCALIATAASAAHAQDAPRRTEVWDLKLGTPIAAVPDDFTDYACGTNGGPPSVPLMGWNDFRRCRPDALGLREVYFRYDDELEYWAKANNFATEIEKYSGTKVYDFPVVLSARFDDAGTFATVGEMFGLARELGIAREWILKVQANVVAGHMRHPSGPAAPISGCGPWSGLNFSAKRACARLRRDRIVPTAQRRREAASAYDNSQRSQSTTT